VKKEYGWSAKIPALIHCLHPWKFRRLHHKDSKGAKICSFALVTAYSTLFRTAQSTTPRISVCSSFSDPHIFVRSFKLEDRRLPYCRPTLRGKVYVTDTAMRVELILSL